MFFTKFFAHSPAARGPASSRRRGTRLGVLLGLLALTLVSSGCDPAGDRTPMAGAGGPAVTDSAGVRIAVSRVPPTGFASFAVVADAPDRTFTPGGDAAARWDAVAGVASLSGGVVAVADANSGSVRFFGASGEETSRVEGLGAISRMGVVRGDTLWVATDADGRLNHVTPEGRVRSDAFPEGLNVVGRFGQDGYLLVPDWSLRFLGGGEADFVEGVRRDTASWAVWWPSGVAGAQVGSFPYDELMVLRGEGGPLVAVPPFGRRTSRAVADDGFFVGDQETFEIRRFGVDGVLQEIWRLEGVDLTLTEALKASVRPLPSPGEPSLVDRLWEGAPATRPAYTRFLLDTTGRLWVAEHVAANAPPRSWLVFSPQGAPRGLVTLPEAFIPFEIGEAHVLGVRDGVDGRQVVRYPLELR